MTLLVSSGTWLLTDRNGVKLSPWQRFDEYINEEQVCTYCKALANISCGIQYTAKVDC